MAIRIIFWMSGLKLRGHDQAWGLWWGLWGYCCDLTTKLHHWPGRPPSSSHGALLLGKPHPTSGSLGISLMETTVSCSECFLSLPDSKTSSLALPDFLWAPSIRGMASHLCVCWYHLLPLCVLSEPKYSPWPFSMSTICPVPWEHMGCGRGGIMWQLGHPEPDQEGKDLGTPCSEFSPLLRAFLMDTNVWEAKIRFECGSIL